MHHPRGQPISSPQYLTRGIGLDRDDPAVALVQPYVLGQDHPPTKRQAGGKRSNHPNENRTRHRHQQVPDCVVLTPDNIRTLPWIPKTCAYRLIAEGKDLYDWHPLVTGDPHSTAKAGMSVAGMVVSEDDFDGDPDWDQHIAEWPGEGD